MQALHSREFIMLWAIVDYMERETKRAKRDIKLPSNFRGGSYIPLTSGMLFNQKDGSGLYNGWVDSFGTEDDVISHPMQFQRIVEKLEKAGLINYNCWTATPQGIQLAKDYLLKRDWPLGLHVQDGLVKQVEESISWR